jgi:hypothetical protein
MEQNKKRRHPAPTGDEVETFRESLGEDAIKYTEAQLFQYLCDIQEVAELLLDIYCDNHGIPCDSDEEVAVRPQAGVRSRARRARNKQH